LVEATKTAKQFLTYVNAAPFQPAIAVGLGLPDDFYGGVAADLETKRDRLFEGLTAAGFEAYKPEATYFTTVDIRPVAPDGDGYAFCRQMPARIGVVAIPNHVFYANQEHGRHLVRFACCKRLEVIDAVVERLARLAGGA
jgi:N-succinyldiaminopimelate aminotransferase